jgi:hypothetical protein
LINLGPILLVLKLIPSTVTSMESYLAILVAFIVFQKEKRKTATIISSVTQKEIVYFER